MKKGIENKGRKRKMKGEKRNGIVKGRRKRNRETEERKEFGIEVKAWTREVAKGKGTEKEM